MIHIQSFLRAFILSSALLLFYSQAAFSQEIVYTVTTSVIPPEYMFSAPSTITSFTVTPTGTPPISSTVAVLPVIGATGLVAGPDQHLYVTDRNTNQILRVNPLTGATSEYANLTPAVPNGGGPTDSPGGLLFVGNNLYVSRFVDLQASSGSGGLDQYTFTSGAGNVPGTPTFSAAAVTNRTQTAGITAAPGVLAGQSTAYQFAGNIFVASLGYSTLGTPTGIPGEVTRYNPSTGFSETFIANATTAEGFMANTNLLSASAVKFGPDGKMYVVDTIANTIRKYDPDTKAYLGDFINSGLDFPSDIVFDGQGHVWVSNLGNETAVTGPPENPTPAPRFGSIKRFDLSGNYIDTVASTGYYAQLAITPEPAAILGMCSLAGIAVLRWKRRRS